MRRLLFIVLIMLIPLTVACRPIVNLGDNVAVVEPLAGGEFKKFFPKDPPNNVVVNPQKIEIINSGDLFDSEKFYLFL